MKKNANIKDIKSLREHWKKAALSRQGEADPVAALIDALLEDRFRFESEAWIWPDNSTARELLLRAWDDKGIAIPQGQALKKIVDEGLFPLLNRFLIFAALQKVSPDENASITLNVTCKTLADKKFWDKLDKQLNGHKPSGIIFEILEYETDETIDEQLLAAAYKKGYRFALDDFSPDKNSWDRLKSYERYIDYIKLDGKFVREGLAGDPAFLKTVQYLRKNYPDIELLAENVDTEQEAAFLYRHGIAIVQGRDLPNPHDPYQPKP